MALPDLLVTCSSIDAIEAYPEGCPGPVNTACCVTALGAYDGIRAMAETLAFMAGTSEPESASG
jgi:hypothetical protein